MQCFITLSAPPNSGQTAVLEAMLVTLMEHGLTPSAISTGLTYLSVPEAMQSAIAAGLPNIGKRFIGAVENTATLLARY